MLPLGPDTMDILDAYNEVKLYNEIISLWGKPSKWYELAGHINSDWGELNLQSAIRGNSMFPLVHISFIDLGETIKVPDYLAGSTLSTPEFREAYKQAAVDIVRAAKPKYFSIGNEVNRWYHWHGDEDDDPNAFRHWVSLYHETYDAVKAVSPEAIVFCVFAREIVAQLEEADMNVLNMFDAQKIDMIVMTTYTNTAKREPGCIIRKNDLSCEMAFKSQPIHLPSHIPDDYFSSVLNYMPGKIIGFSEMSWPSDNGPFGGEELQAEFLMDILSRLTRDQDDVDLCFAM